MQYVKTCLLFLAAPWLLIIANPFEVIEGSACATINDRKTTISNSDGALLHWPKFSIPKNFQIHFEQEHSKCTVLNRVFGSEKSVLEGTLSSNGKVILINPYGIHLSSSALVETAGFIASTLDLSQSKEGMLFENPGSGIIVNEGTILCKNYDILLVSKQIDNQGVCEGSLVEMICTPQILLHPSGKKNIYLETTSLDPQEPPYPYAIRHSGRITASSIREENGQVFLIANPGNTTVSGAISAQGGVVHILGDNVSLESTCSIDVSGSPGGTVLIGGDTRGKNREVLNAKQTSAASGATIWAKGKGNSDGGKVIYWADNKTSIASHTDASAGELGGDGGFIEISGAQIDFQGTVHTLAPKGKPGMTLFDPLDLVISSNIDNAVTASSPFQPTSMVCYPGVGFSNLDIATLTSALMTSSVTIDTSTTSGMCAGLILFDATAIISYNAANNLIINSAQDVIFNTASSITNLGTGSLIINAQREITVNAGVTISLAGGDIRLTGGINSMGQFNSEAYQGIGLKGTPANPTTIQTTGSGTISLTGTGGLGGGTRSRGIDIVGTTMKGSLQIITADGNISLSGIATSPISGSDGINLNNFAEIITTNGLVELTGTTFLSTGSGSQGIQLQQHGYITATGSGSVELIGNAVGNGGVLVQQGSEIQTNSGQITLNGTDPLSYGITLSGSPFAGLIASTGGGAIILIGQGSVGITTDNTSVTTSGSIVLQAISGAQLGTGTFIAPTGSQPLQGTITGDLSLIAGATGSAQIGSNLASSSAPINLQVSGNISMSGNSGFNALIGHGDPTAPIPSLTGNIQVNAAGSINLTGNGGFAQIGHASSMGGGSTIGGDIFVQSGGNITLSNNGDYARIGNGGVFSAAFLSSSVKILAGISLISNGGQIINENGPLTLVVDNLFPTPFGFGSGSLYLDLLSSLAATGELRIYTVTQNQNTILAPINGFPFIPGPFNVNTATEEWSIYYANGSYGTVPFKFYYKLPLINLLLGDVFTNIAANLTAMNSLLPLLRPERLPFQFPAYLAKTCYLYRNSDPSGEKTQPDCAPTLAPYGSFIFQDAIWWTSEWYNLHYESN